MPDVGTVHHMELWVVDLAAARPAGHWLLTSLVRRPPGPAGVSWQQGEFYIVLKHSAALTVDVHRRTGTNWKHITLWAGTEAMLAGLAEQTPEYGSLLLLADRHAHARGP